MISDLKQGRPHYKKFPSKRSKFNFIYISDFPIYDHTYIDVIRILEVYHRTQHYSLVDKNITIS